MTKTSDRTIDDIIADAAAEPSASHVRTLVAALYLVRTDGLAAGKLDARAKSQILSIYGALIARHDADSVLRLWPAIVDLDDDGMNLWLFANRHILERVLLDVRGDAEYLGSLRQRALTFNTSWLPQEVAGTPIFLSALPKSGSTHFCHLLSAYTGKTVLSLHTQNRFREDLDSRVLTLSCRAAAIMQGHNPAGDELSFFLQTSAIRPIILLRNIFDCIISYVAHLERSVHLRRHGFSFAGMSDQEKLDYAIRHLAPNHVHFVASWKKYAEKRACLFLSYENNISDWHQALKLSIDYIGAPWDPKRAEQAIATLEAFSARSPQDLRRRTGKSILKDALTQKHIDEVRSLYRYYSEIDFRDVDPA